MHNLNLQRKMYKQQKLQRDPGSLQQFISEDEDDEKRKKKRKGKSRGNSAQES